jgi:hypothetical protein
VPPCDVNSGPWSRPVTRPGHGKFQQPLAHDVRDLCRLLPQCDVTATTTVIGWVTSEASLCGPLLIPMPGRLVSSPTHSSHHRHRRP